MPKQCGLIVTLNCTRFQTSDGEPFGVTIKGRGKHVDAHNKVMDTINRLPKDKTTTFGDVKFTVNDKVKTSSLLNAKVTILTKDKMEGQVEIKFHKPSDRRQKATIEIRKLNGHEYEAVEYVKDLITNLLDKFTTGCSVSNILLTSKGKSKPYSPLVKQPSLSIKLLSCTDCDYKSKSVVVLKNHIMKNHKTRNSKCDVCGFQSNAEEMKDHHNEFHLLHQNIVNQNKRKKIVFCCDKCGVTVDTKTKLKKPQGITAPHFRRILLIF